ncbi:hypothetical protein PHYC_00512 [Phycisphaerales bacterium]|nr:hypothetical protein PHYC_00512 [Phycisphaerales bacterium]
MGGAKHWQIVLLVAALVALPVSFFWQCSTQETPLLASEFNLVDIKTGELIVAKKPSGKSVYLPAKNPETGEPTYFPAIQQEGKWFVESRFLGTARDTLSGASAAAMDLKTGEMRTITQTPVAKDIFK